MKILILDGAPPCTEHSGKSVRLHNLFKRLGKRHTLHYLSVSSQEEPSEIPPWLCELTGSTNLWIRKRREALFGRYANWLRLMPWFYARFRYPQDYNRLTAALKQLVREERFDWVHCFDEEVAQFFGKDFPCPWIADLGDAMALQAQRRMQHAKTRKERLHWRLCAIRLERFEREIISQSRATVFVSPVDASFYADHVDFERVHTIANGVDADYFCPNPEARYTVSGPPVLLFSGHMSFAPNQDAACFLIDEVLPLVRARIPDVQCYIVGADPTPELLLRHDGRQVFITGSVEDIRPYFNRASVYVCPMRMGSGIKNKLLEAMAMGKAIVTSSRGAEGLEVVDGRHVLFAEDAAACAAQTLGILRDSGIQQSLGLSGRNLSVDRYSWGGVVDAYERLYRTLPASVPANDPIYEEQSLLWSEARAGR